MAKLKDLYPRNEERGLREFMLGYLAAIIYADAQIGRVLDALDNSPYNINTIIVKNTIKNHSNNFINSNESLGLCRL